jgi:ribosomal protein S18 acetylase RimI-like enzyme
MTDSSPRWQVTPDAGNDQAYAILAQDRVWNSFALADLEPPLRDYCQYAVASHDEGNKHAVCLIMRHPIIGQVLSPFGAEEGVAAILGRVALPERPLIQAQERHTPVLEHYYHAEMPWRRMLRMAISSASWRPAPFASARPVVRLDLSDVRALTELYRRHPESAFSADLFPYALYFGVYDGNRIVAAGGTHVLDSAHGIAVLGNILTAPEARGRGYATAVTAALVTALLDRQFSLVVLNVFEDNGAAIRIYQRLGFQTHHRLVIGRAALAIVAL